MENEENIQELKFKLNQTEENYKKSSRGTGSYQSGIGADKHYMIVGL